MGPLTMELAAHEQLKNWCLHVFSFAIDLILFKLASYKDMHKILDEFLFYRPDSNTYCGISGPWVFEKYSKELYWESDVSMLACPW